MFSPAKLDIPIRSVTDIDIECASWELLLASSFALKLNEIMMFSPNLNGHLCFNKVLLLLPLLKSMQRENSRILLRPFYLLHGVLLPGDRKHAGGRELHFVADATNSFSFSATSRQSGSARATSAWAAKICLLSLLFANRKGTEHGVVKYRAHDPDDYRISAFFKFE